MKKRTLLLSCIFLVSVTSFAQSPISLDTALDNCAAHFRNQLPRGATAAVLSIDARSKEFAEYITDSLSARLVAQNHLTVVGRGRDLRVLQAEQTYQMSGYVSDETATSVGKQLGAELIITGSIMPRGDLYAMNIRAVHVETARIQTQWSYNSIRVDPSLVRLDIQAITAVVRFAGTALSINDQDSLIQDLQRGLEDYDVSIEVVPANEATVGTDYNFLITLRVNQRTAVQSADLTVAFRKGNRTLKQSDRHTFSELNTEFIIRKGGDIIRKDRTFFQSLPSIIANQ